MKQIIGFIGAVTAAMLLAACGQKQEPAAEPEAAPAAEAAPAEMAPAESNSIDAEQAGGDKVVEPPPPPEEG
jgi:hypothetical protein